MKTILFALEYPPSKGGVETYYSKLAQYWPDEFAVIDNRSNQLLSKSLPFFKWITAVRTILSAVKNSKPDWIIAGEILPIGTAAWIGSMFALYKYALILHGLDFSLATSSGLKRWLTRHILKKCGKIICANSRTAKEVAEFMQNTNNILVVNPGVDAQAPMVRPGLAAALKENYGLENTTILLCVCRFVARKGIDSVLAVLPRVLEKYPHTAFVIIGQGPDESRLKRLMDDPQLLGKVFMMVGSSEEEKWAWFEASDIFVMPTREIGRDYEGFGIVYLEANLFGKPVIAAESGGVSDAVIDKLNGLLVQQNNSDALAEAIMNLIEDKNLRMQLGEQGKARAINDFSWQKQVEKFYVGLKTS